MSAKEELENKGNQQQIRMTCIDYATRVVGKPVYLGGTQNSDPITKHHDDVVEVAKKIYEFVKGE